MVLGFDFGMVLRLDTNWRSFRQFFHCVETDGVFFDICRRLNHLVYCNRLCDAFSWTCDIAMSLNSLPLLINILELRTGSQVMFGFTVKWTRFVISFFAVSGINFCLFGTFLSPTLIFSLKDGADFASRANTSFLN